MTHTRPDHYDYLLTYQFRPVCQAGKHEAVPFFPDHIRRVAVPVLPVTIGEGSGTTPAFFQGEKQTVMRGFQET
ncbi:MAG: hypothetical protein ABF574_07560 [Gluconobacter japonicus]